MPPTDSQILFDAGMDDPVQVFPFHLMLLFTDVVNSLLSFSSNQFLDTDWSGSGHEMLYQHIGIQAAAGQEQEVEAE